LDVVGGFECKCIPGCSGDPDRGCICQDTLIDLCLGVKCGLNAVCRTLPNKFECYCPKEYPLGDPYAKCKSIISYQISTQLSKDFVFEN
jgi:hypothetical protein